MSTLKVNTIQDTAGADSSTPNQIQQGRAKAWVNFNGTGTVAIRDDYFVSSITDNGTGDYTVNFDSALANVNYSACLTGSNASSGATNGVFAYEHLSAGPTLIRTVSIFRLQTVGTAFSAQDSFSCNVSIFGD